MAMLNRAGLFLTVLVAVIFLGATPPGLQAATITVNSTADSGGGSLRDALATAANGDTIDAPSISGTITLLTGELLVTNSVTILGPGANQLAVDGNAASRVFHIGSGTTVTIAGLTITNGLVTTSFPADVGGGIWNDHATLTVYNCNISGNSGSAAGGGIFNDGRVDSATLTVSNCTLSGNSAGYGGGLFSAGENAGSATLTLRTSTLSGNLARFNGGGLFNYGNAGTATLTVVASTLSDNSATLLGGGLFNNGVSAGSATVKIGSTILNVGGGSGANIYNNAGTITSDGYNLSSDAGVVNVAGGTGDLNAAGDQTNTPPQLGPLQDNGGPTFTHAPLCGSPAIDAGTNFTGSATDQRGLPRTFDDPGIANATGGDGTDIGAVEVQTACLPPCPTCDRDTNGVPVEVVVDQNVTVNFNTKPPTYSGDPALSPYFTFDTNGPTADMWRAIFDVGGKALLITSNATITTTPVPKNSNNHRAPGIEIRSTCSLTVDPGSKILVQSESRQAGDILIQVDGNVTVNGTVSNVVNGTRGRPGTITIVTDCGNIVTGPQGRIVTYGQDYGGSDINVAACDSGDITINGLVDASYKGLSASTINIASFGGNVTIIGTNRFGTEVVAGTLRTVTSGVSVRSRRDPLPGTIKIQAFNDIVVQGSTLLSKKYPNYGAVAIKTASNGSKGGLIEARAINGLLTAIDRAFDDANRFNSAARIDLQCSLSLSLFVSGSIDDGATDNNKAVVSTQGGDTGQGGTNSLRSFNDVIGVTSGAQVLADFTGRPGSVGANLLTGCTGVFMPGTVSPPDLNPGDDAGVCGGGPDPLFMDCSELVP